MQKEMQTLPSTPPFEGLQRQDSSVVDQPLAPKTAHRLSSAFTATPVRRTPLVRDFDHVPSNPLAFGQSPLILNDPGET